jgi:hypothetical protein
MDQRDRNPAENLLDLAFGYRLSQAVYLAAKLGVADLLAGGPREGTDLARSTGTSAPSLSRVLRLLAAAGVFAEVAPDRFALAPPGALLRTDAAESLRASIVMGMELEYPAWGQLLHAVTSGEPGFPRAFGMPVWEYLARNQEMGAVFDAAMVDLTGRQAAAVVAAYDFSGYSVVVDVGGGRGTLLAAILAAHPGLHGVLFDAPQVVGGARPLLDRARVADRCTLVGGDFFESVPEGGDAYVLKWITHDWDDAHAVTILQNCRRAMGARGTLLLVERVLPPGPASAAHLEALRGDVHMLVLLGGRERTAEQFAGLLDAAGFRLDRIVPTGSVLSIVEGTPIAPP